MPTYEYRCDKCGDLFEVRQKFADEPLKTHEDCGGEVHRLLSAPALQFKGSGFYITDYAKGSSSGSNGPSKGESGAKSESGSKDSGSSSESSKGTSEKPKSSTSTETKPTK